MPKPAVPLSTPNLPFRLVGDQALAEVIFAVTRISAFEFEPLNSDYLVMTPVVGASPSRPSAIERMTNF